MDKGNVRIAVISTGIVSSLVLILYLPVLIWSPPWGEDGWYFIEAEENVYLLEGLPADMMIYTYCTFKNGLYTEYGLSDGHIYGQESNLFSKNGSDWKISDSRHNLESHIKIRGKKLYLVVDQVKSFTPKKYDFTKTSNPFTIWYIKWLEWTTCLSTISQT